MHPCPFPLEIGATENQVGGLGLRAPGGPGRGETVLKEDLRKILKSCEGKSGEPRTLRRVFRVLESQRRRS